MTTPELDAIARRAVVCPRWRWMPGMLAVSRGRIIDSDSDGYTVAYIRGGTVYVVAPDDTPDLSDPATLGCLLALVREAWDDPRLSTYPIRMIGCAPWWNVGVPWETDGAFFATASTEAEALVAALEAAP